MSHFIFYLLGRSWSSFLSSLGTTGLGFFVSNIWIFLVTLFVTHLVIWGLKGKTAMKEHAAQNLKITLVVYAIVLVIIFGPIFCYQLFAKVPRSIREQADHQPPPPTVPAVGQKPPRLVLTEAINVPLPSFVFVVPGVVVNENAWDFIIKHEGSQEVESIDVMFVDSDKLRAIQKATPPQGVVLPSEYSVFLHIDKMYPKGRGSLFAKQFIWRPESLEHEHYAIDVSASTGRFHEDLFVEQTIGKWTNAAKVQDVDTKRVTFVCRDHDFPRSLAPTIIARKNCWPNWVKQ
jgi:hypothetical protein